ncbi:MAG: hypothetical protein U9Q73_02790 [Nanoarchaeota archaeon]|nr:hypothetical protein [Nanoarchaeota archaeon]
MKSQKLDMDKTGGERQKEIADLKSRSRHLYELVATENFTVDEVVAESYATSFTPNSKMILGGRFPVYRGGFTSKLVLKVSPDNQNVPVTTLNFNGISVVKAGDYISAQIPRFEEKRVGAGLHSGPYERDRVFYLDRDFNPEESAIELALLSTDRNVLRRDRSINYESFVKK